MKKVIVTGGAGFIGSHLVDKLIEQGTEVIILDDLSTGKEKNINPKATFIRCDVSNIWPSDGYNYFPIYNLFVGVDTIFHLAAKTTVQESIEKPGLYNDINIKGILNMLWIALQCDIKRVVFSS